MKPNAGWLGRAVLSGGLACVATACDDPMIADGEGQAIVYGTVSSDGAPLTGSRVEGTVYTGNQCGDAFRARPFETGTDAAGSYRSHLRVLTRDPFHGCIEIAAVDTVRQASSASITRDGVLFALAPPLDSARIDLEIR